MSVLFICPAYGDATTPGDLVVITDRGRQALDRGTSEDLDSALQTISPGLIDIRAGAWQATTSERGRRRSSSCPFRTRIDRSNLEGTTT